MSVVKIVLTGGPCGGKTTAKEWIQEAFTKLGYNVIFVNEIATEFFQDGITPSMFSSMTEFEVVLAKMQIAKEKIFEEAAMRMQGKTLIVCDRGMMDIKTYLTDEQFKKVMLSLHTNEAAERDKYDAVFHLVTPAYGAEECYTLDNNPARKETPEEAREKDDLTINAWTGHPHLRIIDNSTGFEEKMRRLIREITAFIGEPEPLEIERKYLIKYPDIEKLEKLPNCEKVKIIQTYLVPTESDSERRIRQRGNDGNYTYTLTEKLRISSTTRVEKERRLSVNEYCELLTEADTKAHQIRKDRYCLSHGTQYFEIDIYPFWDDKAIMEVELTSENEPVVFPENIEVIKEVTNDADYSNYNLAHI